MARNVSEDRTRKEMIDPQLEQAGWYLRDHSKVKTEISQHGCLLAGVMTPVELLRGRMGESERQFERLFESLLVLSFVEGLAEAFDGHA